MPCMILSHTQEQLKKKIKHTENTCHFETSENYDNYII